MMTSISSFGPPPSPRTQMNDRISAAVSAGTISKTDQSALSGALDSIDSTLSSSKSSGGSPASMKEKIDSLIDKQVTAGTLTDDQATELKGLFAQGPNGAGGPGGPGGPPPAPPADDESNSDDTTTTALSRTATDKLDAMARLLDKLRASFATDGPYGATGSTAAATTTPTSGLILDQIA